jgi:hypothetical protein
MPTARYTFSVDTKHDRDVIEFLDSFGKPRERSIFIIAALREIIQREERDEVAQFPYERLDAIEKWMEKLWHEWQALKKQRTVLIEQQETTPAEISAETLEEIKKNLENLTKGNK